MFPSIGIVEVTAHIFISLMAVDDSFQTGTPMGEYVLWNDVFAPQQ